MPVGYAANGDRDEDCLAHAQPMGDSQQPLNRVTPRTAYPSSPLLRDVPSGFLVSGQISSQSLTPATPGQRSVHNASEFPPPKEAGINPRESPA